MRVLWVGFTITALSWFWGCGGSVENAVDGGGGSAATGGGAAATGGGAAATGGGGGTAGIFGGSTGSGSTPGTGGSSLTCNSAFCPEYSVGGLIHMSACCSTNDKCGTIVDGTISGLLGGIPTGCYESEQAGDIDCVCPGYAFTSPLPPNELITFPGCCTPSGACGYVIDVSSVSGPVIGCQEASWGDGMGQTCTVGSPDLSCHADGGAGAGGAGGADGGSADAATD